MGCFKARGLTPLCLKQGYSSQKLLVTTFKMSISLMFFVSDMKRAKQTAEIIIKKNKTCNGLALVVDPLLKERVKVRVSAFLKSMLQLMADHHRDKISWADKTQRPENDGSVVGCPGDGVLSVPAHALVVTHGAYMRVAVRYFIQDLGCSVPLGSDMIQLFSACSNTGMCHFMVTLKYDDAELLSSMKCVFVNRTDHIKAE